MFPIARKHNILIQSVKDEIVVYDQENNISHCLNPIAAQVWRWCNGESSIDDIAQQLALELGVSAPEAIDLVYLSLDELEKANLVSQTSTDLAEASLISRRRVVKSATLVGGFAIGSMFPLVRSLLVPEPAMASSSPRRVGKSKRRVGKGRGKRSRSGASNGKGFGNIWKRLQNRWEREIDD